MKTLPQAQREELDAENKKKYVVIMGGRQSGRTSAIKHSLTKQHMTFIEEQMKLGRTHVSKDTLVEQVINNTVTALLESGLLAEKEEREEKLHCGTRDCNGTCAKYSSWRHSGHNTLARKLKKIMSELIEK